MARTLAAALAWLTDLAITAVALTVGLILVTGGTTLHLGDVTVGLRSVANPLSFLIVLGAIRYWCGRRRPFLGMASLSADALEAASLGAGRRLHGTLSTIPNETAFRLVALLAVATLGVRLLNAYFHYGFFAGDDVEVHELTLGRLLGRAWPVWELRSPFYPLLFVYPAQWGALRLGFADPGALVFAGRLVVALIASLTLVLLFQVTKKRYGLPIAVLSVVFLAASFLHIRMGSTELPRPVAAFFLVAAFGLLSGRASAGRRPPSPSDTPPARARLAPLLASIALGIAAALRFSEAIFVLPAVAVLVAERRLRDAFIVAAGFSATLAACLGISDGLFWGTPFYGLRNAVDYTLVRGLSSRGYQPFHYYVTHLTEWTDPFTFGLALGAVGLGFRKAAAWAWIPVLTLSLFPHKEARYLVPVLPFLAISAACALWTALGWLASHDSTRARRVAVLLLVGALAAAAFNLAGWRFERSERSVDLARSLAPRCRGEVVAAEQAWRLGGRIYLPEVADLVEIAPQRLREPGYLEAVAASPRTRWVLLRTEHADTGRVAVLGAAGYVEASGPDPGYRVFQR